MTALIATYAPWLLTLVGGAALWVCGRHPVGWIMVLLAQVIYMILGVVTRQPGWLLHAGIYGVVAVRNYVTQSREAKRLAKMTGVGYPKKPLEDIRPAMLHKLEKPLDIWDLTNDEREAQ